MKKIASWVIVKKQSGNGVFETFSKKVADAINTKKYEGVPILDYLVALNKRIKENKI